ncbi:hypothetical protein D1872_267850 [compost metagenome]
MKHLRITAAVTIDRYTLASQIKCQLIQTFRFFHCEICRAIRCFGNRAVHPALNRSLGTNVIFSRQIHCCNEIIRQGLAWMAVQPFLGNWNKLLIEAKTALTIIFEGKIRFNPCRCAYHCTCTACWSLRNDRNVANTFFLNRFTNLRVYLSHHLHKTALQIFICFKSRERSLLGCNVSGSQVSFFCDEAV